MPHTNYKQMIEEGIWNIRPNDGESIRELFSGGDMNNFEFAKEILEPVIKSFLKFQVIKSLNNEIEVLESKKKLIKQDCNECLSCESGMSNCDIRDQDRQYNQAIDDHISYLLAQRKLIEEDL